jgi:hypothetical protein
VRRYAAEAPRRASRQRAIVAPLLAVGSLSLAAYGGKGRAQDPARVGAPPAVGASVTFRDVAGRSRFSYVTNNNFTGRKYFPQPMCGGVALVDYDGDAALDVFLTNGSKLPELSRPDPSFYNCLLRGRGDGTFEDVTAKAGLEGRDLGFSFGVAAADLDNDGDTDLFVANAGPNTLYRNNGDGTFTDVTRDSGLDRKPKDLLSVSGAFFDYDDDGLLDLVVAHYTYWSPQLDRPCRTADGEVYCYPATYKGVPNTLYRNLGNGRFADVSEKTGFSRSAGKGMGIAIADYNGDGRIDAFVANDTEPNFLYVNRGDGTFAEESWSWGIAYDELGAVVSAMGADARDVNDDGWPDIFYNNLQGQLWALFRNEGGRRFLYVSPSSGIGALSRRFSGWSAAILDYDNDGRKDVYSANGDVDYLGSNAAQHDTMFRNVSGETFADVSHQLGPDFTAAGFQRGSAWGDLNGDGFPDLVVTSLKKRPRILLNSAGNGNHWLWLELVGTASNRDAIGARVKLTTASGRVLYNHVTTSVGFMSSSDRRVHFGLGGESRLTSLEIRWPSGRLQTLENVDADRVLRLTEPLADAGPGVRARTARGRDRPGRAGSHGAEARGGAQRPTPPCSAPLVEKVGGRRSATPRRVTVGRAAGTSRRSPAGAGRPWPGPARSGRGSRASWSRTPTTRGRGGPNAETHGGCCASPRRRPGSPPTSSWSSPPACRRRGSRRCVQRS